MNRNYDVSRNYGEPLLGIGKRIVYLIATPLIITGAAIVVSTVVARERYKKAKEFFTPKEQETRADNIIDLTALF